MRSPQCGTRHAQVNSTAAKPPEQLTELFAVFFRVRNRHAPARSDQEAGFSEHNAGYHAAFDPCKPWPASALQRKRRRKYFPLALFGRPLRRDVAQSVWPTVGCDGLSPHFVDRLLCPDRKVQLRLQPKRGRSSDPAGTMTGASHPISFKEVLACARN